MMSDPMLSPCHLPWAGATASHALTSPNHGIVQWQRLEKPSQVTEPWPPPIRVPKSHIPAFFGISEGCTSPFSPGMGCGGGRQGLELPRVTPGAGSASGRVLLSWIPSAAGSPGGLGSLCPCPWVPGSLSQPGATQALGSGRSEALNPIPHPPEPLHGSRCKSRLRPRGLGLGSLGFAWGPKKGWSLPGAAGDAPVGISRSQSPSRPSPEPGGAAGTAQGCGSLISCPQAPKIPQPVELEPRLPHISPRPAGRNRLKCSSL